MCIDTGMTSNSYRRMSMMAVTDVTDVLYKQSFYTFVICVNQLYVIGTTLPPTTLYTTCFVDLFLLFANAIQLVLRPVCGTTCGMHFTPFLTAFMCTVLDTMFVNVQA